MAELIVCPGLDEAVIGTFANEHEVLVPVYDINRVFDIFERQNQSHERAVAWVQDILGSWSEQIRPIFINYQPGLSAQVAAGRIHKVN